MKRQRSFGNRLILKRALVSNSERDARHIVNGNAKVCRPTMTKLGVLYLAKECQALGVLDELIDQYEEALGIRMFLTTKIDLKPELIKDKDKLL